MLDVEGGVIVWVGYVGVCLLVLVFGFGKCKRLGYGFGF